MAWLWYVYLICDIHYNCIKKKYGNKSKLLFTDRDSLIYEINTKDVYKEIKIKGKSSLVSVTVKKIQNFMAKQKSNR